MLITAIRTGECYTNLYEAFASSGAYLDAVHAKTNENAKRQSIAGLQALLLLLRSYGVDPKPLVLARDSGGKPYFANCDLRFGISHSAELAVCALGREEIGVDVELVKEKKNIETFAKRFFSQSECDIIAVARDKTDAFLTVWTKKEALLKLRGEGVDRPLAEVDTAREHFTVFDVREGGRDYIVTVAGTEETEVIGGIRWIRRK